MAACMHAGGNLPPAPTVSLVGRIAMGLSSITVLPQRVTHATCIAGWLSTQGRGGAASAAAGRGGGEVGDKGFNLRVGVGSRRVVCQVMLPRRQQLQAGAAQGIPLSHILHITRIPGAAWP